MRSLLTPQKHNCNRYRDQLGRDPRKCADWLAEECRAVPGSNHRPRWIQTTTPAKDFTANYHDAHRPGKGVFTCVTTGTKGTRNTLPNIGMNLAFTASGIGKLIPATNQGQTLGDTFFAAEPRPRLSVGDPADGNGVPTTWLPRVRRSVAAGYFFVPSIVALTNELSS